MDKSPVRCCAGSGCSAPTDSAISTEARNAERACEDRSCCDQEPGFSAPEEACGSVDPVSCSKTSTECCSQPQETSLSPTCALGSDSCCDGSVDTPCCTDDCALAFAQYECDMLGEDCEQQLQPASGGSTTSPTHPRNQSDKNGDRLRNAFDKYAAMIQEAICLCRNVSSSNVVRCCARKPRHGGATLSAMETATAARGQVEQTGDEKRSSSATMEAFEVQGEATERKQGCCGSKGFLAEAAAQPSQHRQSASDHQKCCSPSEKTSKTVTVEIAKPARIVHAREKGCCENDESGCANSVKTSTLSEAHERCKQGCCAADEGMSCSLEALLSEKSACCGPKSSLSQEDTCCKSNSCRDVESAHERRAGVSADACRDACCSQEPESAPGPVKRAPLASKKDVDVEAGAHLESVLIDVQGMTCTGCEGKLAAALAATAGVSQIQVVFVSGRAEFKVDTSAAAIPQVISQVQAHTGFRITQVRQDLACLDFLASKHASMLVAERLLLGAVSVERISRRLVRVSYDPSRIKARSLVADLEREGLVLAPDANPDKDGNTKHVANLIPKTLLAIALTIPVCVLAWADTKLSELSKGTASLILATLVQGVAISEFYWNALRSLYRSHILELDMLVVISVTAAYTYSVIAFAFLSAGHPLAIKEFFETSTLLISLVLLGRLIAGYARAKAVASVSLRSFQATSVTILLGDGSEQQVDARLLHFGDVFLVPPHTRIATDGTIVAGESDVDESVVTGESIPVVRGPGSGVVAGSTNGSGQLKVRVDRLPGKNTLTDIAELVEAAQSSKPRVQSLADTLAGYFIPVVLAIAAIVVVVWIPVSICLRGLTTSDAIVNAITYAVAVLAVSCPCALGLAVPMVLVITGGIAARHGIIIKSASATERAWSITDVVFDKTGTLTLQDLEVCYAEILDDHEEAAFPATLALAKANNHPVSRSVAAYLTGRSVRPLDLQDCRSLPGKGVESKQNGSSFCIGSPEWLKVEDHSSVQRLRSQQLTVLCTTANNVLVAVFALRSTLRPEAPSVLTQLHARGLTTHLLSGDTNPAVQQVGHALKIRSIYSRQSPEDKGLYIDALVSDPRRRVLFCGDGTNDAVAIARAHVGVSMGTASDVTAGSADVTLLGSLEGIIGLLDLSKAAYRRIMFNFVWSAVYNVFAILLAAGAFVVVRLPPAYAGLGELVSVLPVVLVAGTMLLWRRKL